MTDTDELKERLKKQYAGYGRPAGARFLPRVWDGKQYYYPKFSELGITYDSDNGDSMSLSEAFGWIFDTDRDEDAVCFKYILEACTGMRDASGKLIYEGDIIEDTHSEIKSRYTIKWNAEKGFWMADTYALAMCVEALGGRYSIISNIHEGEKE